MHCISLAILSRLSRFPSPAVGTNWPFCVDVPLKHQSINQSPINQSPFLTLNIRTYIRKLSHTSPVFMISNTACTCTIPTHLKNPLKIAKSSDLSQGHICRRSLSSLVVDPTFAGLLWKCPWYLSCNGLFNSWVLLYFLMCVANAPQSPCIILVLV